MPPRYLSKCTKCGNTRETYNDPRLRKSVTECKAKCFESHYEWELVRVLEESESAPTTAAAPASTTTNNNTGKYAGMEGPVIPPSNNSNTNSNGGKDQQPPISNNSSSNAAEGRQTKEFGANDETASERGETKKKEEKWGCTLV